MEPEPVAEPSPAPASERPVRAAAQKAAQKKAEEAEAAAKKKAASGKATAAALQKKLAAQKEAASAAEAAQKARIEELEAELLRQQARAAEAGASPRSAYGTPAKGQGHVSGENDNLEVELEAALGDEGEGAGELVRQLSASLRGSRSGRCNGAQGGPWLSFRVSGGGIGP